MSGDLTRQPVEIPTRHIADGKAVRMTAGRYVGHPHKPVSRHTLIYWRERHGFPQPLDAPRCDAELWDIREVREWCREYVARRHAEAQAASQ